jgi:hypothetical protein
MPDGDLPSGTLLLSMTITRRQAERCGKRSDTRQAPSERHAMREIESA